MMLAARAALRSSVFRRSIHTTRTSNPTRSSWATSAAVLLAGGATYVAYHSWDLNAKNRKIALEEKAPQKPPPAKSASKEARKSADNTSVDAPAPAKPSPSEPGVLKPSDEAPAPTPVVGSDPPTDDDAESEEDKDRAASQGAYNPETGEINWDCPCLGGMAHGPCGPQFREAFSCFIYSNEEPKGVDCVEKFKEMQDCFREHPDVYGEEIDDEDEDEAVEEPEKPSDSSQQSDDKSTSTVKPDSEDDEKRDTPPGVPSPPSSAPPSRQNAPTANVSPDTTPTKRGGSH